MDWGELLEYRLIISTLENLIEGAKKIPAYVPTVRSSQNSQSWLFITTNDDNLDAGHAGSYKRRILCFSPDADYGQINPRYSSG